MFPPILKCRFPQRSFGSESAAGRDGHHEAAGRIDRIDVCEDKDQVYVKVVDYKSGSTEFDLAAMYYGLQLQLVVYLNAAMELEGRIRPEKEIVPAGIFYYHIKDPMLEASVKSDLGVWSRRF